jgi:ubiquitin carboxyl-terminal hydrolase L3
MIAQAECSLEPMSTLSQTLSAIHGKSVEEVAKVLEGSQELETTSHAVATQGSTSPPPNAEDEVDYHYICFVKSEDGSCLYELDGERNGPIKRVSLPPKSDMLCEAVLQVVRSYLQAEKEGSLEFNLMALCNRQNKEEVGISDVGTQGVSLSEKDS